MTNGRFGMSLVSPTMPRLLTNLDRCCYHSSKAGCSPTHVTAPLWIVALTTVPVAALLVKTAGMETLFEVLVRQDRRQTDSLRATPLSGGLRGREGTSWRNSQLLPLVLPLVLLLVQRRRRRCLRCRTGYIHARSAVDAMPDVPLQNLYILFVCSCLLL